MLDAKRFLDIGTIVGADPTGETDTVYAHFEGTDYEGPEPFAVPINGAQFDEANISRNPGTEFWAEINDGSTDPSQVEPQVLPDSVIAEE